MVCNKWESEGLLLTSNELSPQEEKSYRQHLTTCSACQTELDSYSMMKSSYFVPGLFEDAPSFSMDALFESVKAEEKVATPSAPKKREVFVLGMPLFAFMQQRVAPAFLLVMGIVVGYSFLPSATGIASQVAEKSESAIHRTSDSLGNQDGDSLELREFREGASFGIRSVDVVE